MSPLAPFNLADQKDTLFRFPEWKMFTRPRLINQQNVVKEQAPDSAKPEPNKN
jgi:spore germination protein KA